MNNINTIDKNDNKSKMIDYIILLKLMMKHKNVYFPNNFYVEWLSYLLPNSKIRISTILNKNYYEFSDTNDFITKYNIKDAIKDAIVEHNFNKSIPYVSINVSNKTLFDKKIIYVKIEFIKKYFFYIFCNIILKFEYEIPYEYIIKFKNINTFTDFDNLIKNIYGSNYGVFMNNYLDCNEIEKNIYYDLFKKIIKIE